MKSYAIVRKWRIPFTRFGIATRRFVTLDEAIEFILQKQMAFGQSDDIGAALKAGAIFSSRKYDVLSAAKISFANSYNSIEG